MSGSVRSFITSFIRFAISGGGVAVVAVATYYLCAVPLGLPPLIANLIAYLIQLAVGYQAHRIFSFRHGRTDVAVILRYCVMSLAALGINSLWVWILTDVAALAHWTPILPMIGVTPFATFALARLWVFADRSVAGLTVH